MMLRDSQLLSFSLKIKINQLTIKGNVLLRLYQIGLLLKLKQQSKAVLVEDLNSKITRDRTEEINPMKIREVQEVVLVK